METFTRSYAWASGLAAAGADERTDFAGKLAARMPVQSGRHGCEAKSRRKFVRQRCQRLGKGRVQLYGWPARLEGKAGRSENERERSGAQRSTRRVVRDHLGRIQDNGYKELGSTLMVGLRALQDRFEIRRLALLSHPRRLREVNLRQTRPFGLSA